jgi:hypothetical protein
VDANINSSLPKDVAVCFSLSLYINLFSCIHYLNVFSIFLISHSDEGYPERSLHCWLLADRIAKYYIVQGESWILLSCCVTLLWSFNCYVPYQFPSKFKVHCCLPRNCLGIHPIVSPVLYPPLLTTQDPSSPISSLHCTQWLGLVIIW